MVGDCASPFRDSLDEGPDVRTLYFSPPEMAALEFVALPD